MLSTLLQDFEEMAELQFPLIINPSNCVTEEIQDDYSVADYSLERELDLDEFLDMMESHPEMLMLFRNIPTEHTPAGRSVCLYSAPSERQMFKVYAKTNGKGTIDMVTVTVYASHDSMRFALCEDIALAKRLPGKTVCRSRKDLDIDFMVLS